VPINDWWADNLGERYWLEITDRDDLGTDLNAPKVDDAGNPYWSYNLVRYVRSGDVVFHWHKPPGRSGALRGYSEAKGSLTSRRLIWTAHGTYGRARGTGKPEPGWRFPLTAYTELTRPITQDRLRELEPILREVHADLAREYPPPLYFPFAFSDRRPVRPAQGYLVKFPATLVSAVPELRQLRLAESGSAQPFVRNIDGRSRKRAQRSGYLNNEHLRKALENQMQSTGRIDTIADWVSPLRTLGAIRAMTLGLRDWARTFTWR
jgi:hypothetical protein